MENIAPTRNLGPNRFGFKEASDTIDGLFMGFETGKMVFFEGDIDLQYGISKYEICGNVTCPAYSDRAGKLGCCRRLYNSTQLDQTSGQIISEQDFQSITAFDPTGRSDSAPVCPAMCAKYVTITISVCQAVVPQGQTVQPNSWSLELCVYFCF